MSPSISRSRRTIASSMMRIPIPSFLVLFLVAHLCTSFAPTITSPSSIIRRNINSWSLNLLKQDGNKQNEVESSTATPSGKEVSEREKDIANFINKNPFELASWYAVEAFGKAFGSKRSVDNVNDDQEVTESIDLTKPPSSLEETLKRIKLDNDRSYFLSGEVDSLIYDEACIFADPFVAFSGRDRFIENLSNLGSFITNYDAKMIKYDVEGDGREIVTKIMVKLELNLPWKPVLAWPWGVSYLIDPDTFLVTKHTESWDIEPWKGVQQIFRRPTVKVGNKLTIAK